MCSLDSLSSGYFEFVSLCRDTVSSQILLPSETWSDGVYRRCIDGVSTLSVYVFLFLYSVRPLTHILFVYDRTLWLIFICVIYRWFIKRKVRRFTIPFTYLFGLYIKCLRTVLQTLILLETVSWRTFVHRLRLRVCRGIPPVRRVMVNLHQIHLLLFLFGGPVSVLGPSCYLFPQESSFVLVTGKFIKECVPNPHSKVLTVLGHWWYDRFKMVTCYPHQPPVPMSIEQKNQVTRSLVVFSIYLDCMIKCSRPLVPKPRPHVTTLPWNPKEGFLSLIHTIRTHFFLRFSTNHWSFYLTSSLRYLSPDPLSFLVCLL